jgi:hypothetical protein
VACGSFICTNVLNIRIFHYQRARRENGGKETAKGCEKFRKQDHLLIISKKNITSCVGSLTVGHLYQRKRRNQVEGQNNLI